MPARRKNATQLLKPLNFWPPKTAEKMRYMRMRFQENCWWTESNPIYSQNARYLDYTIKFGYQRLNLSFPNPLEDQPYPQLKWLKNTNAHLLYTSSGQSASLVVFWSLQELGFKMKKTQSGSYYYETTGLINKVALGLNSKGTKKRSIYLIDSSTLQTDKPNLPKDCIVVFDTTCWDRNSPLIKNLVTKSLAKRNITILIRSHTKLDSQGVEWNRLGSVLTLGNANQIAEFEKIKSHFIDTSSLFGARAEIRSLYPFLKDKRFTDQTTGWIRKVRSSNIKVSKLLKALTTDVPVEVETFQHSLFFWIRLPKVAFSRLSNQESQLVKSLSEKNIASIVIASFPWDFVAITSFEMKLDTGTQTVLRISCPPMTTKEIPIAAREIVSFVMGLHAASSEMKG